MDEAGRNKLWENYGKTKSPEEMQGINIMRKALNGLKPEEAVEKILDMFVHTKNNKEFIDTIQKIKFF